MILRASIVIYYFEQPRIISRLVKDVLQACDLPVLLIDDGSEVPVGHSLYSFEVKQALESSRLRLLRFDKAQGKSSALQHAVNDLVSRGVTHMLTMNGDLSHSPDDIGILMEQALARPFSLIIGKRILKQRRLSRFFDAFMRKDSAVQVRDVHSGFRVYPLFFLQGLSSHIWPRGEFELQSLVRLLWRGVSVREVEVKSPEGASGTPAFSWRAALLNATIRFLLILREHDRPTELAVAVGLGVFVGCTPTFGLHTLTVVILALVLRLNVVALWLGTHVSTPLLFPFVVGASVYIGKHWLGIVSAPGYMSHVYQWAAGSLVLGVLLGVPSGLATFVAARSFRLRRSAERFAGPGRLGFRAGWPWAGWPWPRQLVTVRSWWIYLSSRRARRGLSEFYRLVEPRTGFWRRQLRILAHLKDSFRLTFAGPGTELREGTELRDGRELREGTEPRLLLCAHMADWERAASYELREKFPLAQDLQHAAQLLRVGGCARIFFDRPASSHFELLPFFGRLAPFDVAALDFAKEHGVRAALSVGVKTESGECELVTRELRGHDPVSRLIMTLEFLVRKYPTSWMNLYPFWSDPSISNLPVHASLEGFAATSGTTGLAAEANVSAAAEAETDMSAAAEAEARVKTRPPGTPPLEF
jgi:hypothetical protein